MECTFLELRCKEVVNVVDGKKLGHVVDIVFDLQNCCVCGLVVPSGKGYWNIFKSNQDIFVPFSQICKIGQDTILVELYTETPQQNCATCMQKK